MPKAVLKNGVICPLSPLPSDWPEGQELLVEAISEDESDQDFDAWFQELQAMVAQNDPADWAQVEGTIQAAKEQAKTRVRKEMGLP